MGSKVAGEVLGKAAMGMVGSMSEKATGILKVGAGEIRVYIEKNHYSIRVLSLCGGAALSVLSFLGLLNIFASLFGPFAYVLKFYELAFGLTICVIDGPRESTPRLQGFVMQYLSALHNNLGRALFYLFLACFEGTQDSWVHMLVGWYFLGISVIFCALKAKSICSGGSGDGPGNLGEESPNKGLTGDIKASPHELSNALDNI